MRNLSELPKPLIKTPFTAKQAANYGITAARLRGKDLQQILPGLYLHESTPLNLENLAAGVIAKYPSAIIHSISAAVLYKFPLPTWLLPVGETHETNFQAFSLIKDNLAILLPYKSRAIKAPFIDTHYHQISNADTATLQTVSGIKLPIVSRKYAWLHTCSQVPFDVAVGITDHLLREPRATFEHRIKPFYTLPELESFMDSVAGRAGVQAARSTLQYTRIGADSLPETRLRLALLAAGLEEPILNPILNIFDPVSGKFLCRRQPDLYFPSIKLLVEYDGATHMAVANAVNDRNKDLLTRQAGYRVVRIYKSDLPPISPLVHTKAETFKILRDCKAVQLIRAELAR